MTLTRSQVRELDRRAIDEFGIPGVVLMENAGRGFVNVMQRIGITGPVHIVCGKGNNGGDGFVIARLFDAMNIPVVIHRCCLREELTGDAAINFQIIERAKINIVTFTAMEAFAHQLSQAQWIVDALLGTGLSGRVRSPYADIIRCMNATGKPILAVDLPSGMDADTGESLGDCIIAQQTVTFVTQKAGFANHASKQFTGIVHVADIGVPRLLLQEFGL